VSRQLQISAVVASIRITSQPAGAAIYIDGQLRPGVVTPSDEILVEANKKHVVRLELPGYMPTSVTITPSAGSRSVPVEAKLERAVSLSATSNLDARIVVSGAPLCEKQPLPFTCQLRRGKHQVKIETTKLTVKIVRDVTIGEADVKLDVAWGVVVPPAGHKLVVAGKAVDRAAFEAGKRVLVTIRDADGVTGQVEVKPVAGKTVEAQ
jgi:hypothetical protein